MKCMNWLVADKGIPDWENTKFVSVCLFLRNRFADWPMRLISVLLYDI